MITLTRQALYDRVWTDPMTKIAADLGVSSSGLKAICDRAAVPVPRAGYWQKRAVGRAGKPSALPCETRLATEPVILVSRPRVRAASPAPKTAASPASTTSTRPVVEADRSEHPATLKLRKALEKAKPSPAGFVTAGGGGVVPAVLSPDAMDRALTWLDDFLRQAEALGMRFEADPSGTRLRVEGESVPFRLEEKSDKVPHTPTPAELRTKAERERWAFAYRSDPWPKYDHRPSGRLSIHIEANPYSGLRRSFADGKTQRLEALIEDVLEAFRTHAAAVAERRRQAEVARSKAEAQQRRRERRAAFEAREGRRAAFVAQIADALERRAALQRVLDHLRDWPPEEPGPPGLDAFVERQLAEEEARVSAQFLELSARAAKIDFDEARARTAPSQPSWHHPSAVVLELWRLEADRAVSVTGLEWAEDAERLPSPLEEDAEG